MSGKLSGEEIEKLCNDDPVPSPEQIERSIQKVFEDDHYSKEMLAEYINSKLGDKQAVLIELHVSGCEKCFNLLASVSFQK